MTAPREARPSRPPLLLTLLLAWGCLQPAVGGAADAAAPSEERAAAKAYFDAGKRLFAQEAVQEAAGAFEASIAIYPTKSAYFNLATCYRLLSRYDDALETIHRLETRFEAEITAPMQQQIDALRAGIHQIVGTLIVAVTPPGATVRINGEAIRDRAAVLPEGAYEVSVTHPDHQAETRTVTLQPGTRIKIDIDLEPLPGALWVRTDQPGLAVTVDGDRVGDTPLARALSLGPGAHRIALALDGREMVHRDVDILPGKETSIFFQLAEARPTPETKPALSPAETEGAARPRRPLKAASTAGFAAAGTAAALTGLFYGLAAANASVFRDKDAAYASAPNREVVEQRDSERRDAYDKTQLFAGLGLALGVTAGVLTVASTVLAISASRRGENEQRAVSVKGGALVLHF